MKKVGRIDAYETRTTWGNLSLPWISPKLLGTGGLGYSEGLESPTPSLEGKMVCSTRSYVHRVFYAHKIRWIRISTSRSEVSKDVRMDCGMRSPSV